MIVKHVRGHKMLLVNDYTYSKVRASQDNKSWWKCTAKGPAKCAASLTMINDVITKMNGEDHNHSPPIYKIDKYGLYHKI